MSVAQLGIVVDSSPASKASDDLRKLAAGAAAAEAAAHKLTGAARLTSNQLLNLSRQGNDVITMFALGANPMQIFASQAGQIVDALQSGPGGLKGSLAAIGESLVSLITRFPIATAAIAAATAAVGIYALTSGKDIETVDEILKKHEQNIRLLGDAYKDAGNESRKYALISVDTAELFNKGDIAKLQDKLREAIDEIINGATNRSAVGKSGGMRFFIKGEFAPFKEAIEELQHSARDATALREFNDRITELASKNPELTQTAAKLIDLGRNALAVASAMQEVGGEIDPVTTLFDEFARKLDAVDSKRIEEELQKIFDKANEGKVPIDELMKEIAALEQANPSFSGIIAGFKGLINEAWEASGALDALAQKYASQAGGSPNGRGSLPVGILPDTVSVTPDNRPSFEDELSRRAKGGRKTDPYRDIIKSAADRIAQMRQELELTGQVGEATDAARYELELLSRATDKGRSLTEKQKDQIKELADEYAHYKTALKEAGLESDLLFDRQQLLRTSTEQLIASTQRSAGLKIDFTSSTAEAIRLNEIIADTRDILEDTASTITHGIVDALKDGKLELSELGDIASSVLGNLSQKLLDMAADQAINWILNAIFGGIGGGLGGAGAGLSSHMLNTAAAPAASNGFAPAASSAAAAPVNFQVIDQRHNSTPALKMQEGLGPNGERHVRMIIGDTLDKFVQSPQFGAGVALARDSRTDR